MFDDNDPKSTKTPTRDAIDALSYGISMKPDMVNHPPHYKLYDTDLEVLDVILASMPAEHRPSFLRAQILKYILRSDRKNGLEDLQKAEFYLKKWIALESVKD